MKHVNITQWVRGRKLSSPSRPKTSHQVGSRTEVRSPRGDVRSRGEARIQAALLCSENGYSCGQMDKSGQPDQKPTRCTTGKAAVLFAPRQAGGTPPGSESGACIHRGNPGTRESLPSPWDKSPEHGWPAQITPGRVLADAASGRTDPGVSRKGHKERVNPRYRKGAQSAPTGTDEGSRSNAMYRGAGDNSCPEAWGTEAQGTHDKSRKAAGRQCRAWRRCQGKAGGTLSPQSAYTQLARNAHRSERRLTSSDGQQKPCRLVVSSTARFLARKGHD